MRSHYYQTLIVYWSHILTRRSYWHGATGLGISFRPGELRDYYRDYSPKVHWKGEVDDLQLPLVQEPGGKPFHSPIVLTQKALGHWSSWLTDKESPEKHLENFLQLARWLVTAQESQGSWDLPSMHKPIYTVPYSALVQGQAVSVLVRAFSVTSNGMYLESASRGLKFLLKPVPQGGTCRIIEVGPILEEYPSQQPRTVLNGWISALYGLYDFLLVEEHAEVQAALDATFEALLMYLPRYDAKYWSFYDTVGTIASPYYHQVHITQLKALERTFPQHSIALKAQRARFEAQSSSPLCRTKAVALKVIQKLKQPPQVLVTQTLKTH